MVALSPAVLGVDVGTTGVKVVAFGGPRPVTAVREYPLLEPAPGQQVQDVDQVLAATAQALAEVVARLEGRPVAALGLSTAMHGLLGLDADARPLTPLVTWADSRSAPQAAALRSSGEATALHEATGTPVHPMSPLTKLAWFAEHEPGLASRVRTWAGLKDVLVHLLTGWLATERSSASATGLLDRWTGTWHERALQLARVRADQLPEVLPTTAHLPLDAALARHVGLPAGTPVVLGAGDGPLATLGAGALAPGLAGLSLGTSGAVRALVRQQPEHLDPALFCYALTEGAWVLGGAVSTGGLVVRWASSSLVPGADDDAVLRLAAQVPAGSEGLLMLPYLLPERAPSWDPELPGAYLGLRRCHTRAHLVRAAVEGVALQLAAVLDRLDASAPMRQVRATGGALRAPLWREVLAATTARPFVAVAAAEGTALGAAALALLGTGQAEDLEEAVAKLGGTEEGETVEADPALVTVYAEARERLRTQLDRLATLAQHLS